jgi:hypothetical protein
MTRQKSNRIHMASKRSFSRKESGIRSYPVSLCQMAGGSNTEDLQKFGTIGLGMCCYVMGSDHMARKYMFVKLAKCKCKYGMCIVYN